MRKLIMLVVALMALTAVVAGVASASTPTVTYTGQGFTGDNLTTNKCDAPDNGSTGTPLVPGQNYLLWVLSLNATPTNPSGVILHLPDGEHNMTQVGGTWKFVSKYFTKAALVGQPAHATYNGTSSRVQLVVSHGCARAPSHVVTKIHNADHGVITEADLGSTVHDSAQVTVDGGVAIPAGSTVKFKFYDKNGQVGSDDVEPVGANGSVDPALPEGPLHAGSYHYTASFTSGNLNLVGSSTADDEPLTINQGQLKIVTQTHGVNGADDNVGGDTHVALGSTVHDTATVSVADGSYVGFDIPGASAVSFTRDSGNGFDPIDNDTTGEAGFTARTVESLPLHAGS